MENINKEISEKIASELVLKHASELPFIGFDIHDCDTFEHAAQQGAMKMAELKDKAIRQFFIEHIPTDVEIKTNEDGQPLADSFIKAQMRRIELAETMYNIYKEFEKRML